MNCPTGRPVYGLNAVKHHNRKESFDVTNISQHQVTILVSSVGEDSSSIASEAKEVSFLGCSFD